MALFREREPPVSRPCDRPTLLGLSFRAPQQAYAPRVTSGSERTVRRIEVSARSRLTDRLPAAPAERPGRQGWPAAPYRSVIALQQSAGNAATARLLERR